MNLNRMALIYNESIKSIKIIKQLKELYDFKSPEEADIIIVVGGDGELLHTLHKYLHLNLLFYGINAGSIGFLMNPPHLNELSENIKHSLITKLYPLEMYAEDLDGHVHYALAINECSIFRSSNQSAKLKIEVDGIEQISELIGDGILISTPAGSSAYNLSAGGFIVPLSSNVLCLTPICPFRPRRWRGAILSSSVLIKCDILDYHQRPVNAVADFYEFKNIKSVLIKSADEQQAIKLLFNKDHSLENRMIKEQFSI